ncbi:TrbC/VIRB2 family protein [mine drainage metagenome]|uniref:TrbC/VIRB2 family protein n=1 Tax=mine drainage metagenome TaxID=410659 RepID=A0A1J5QBK2_9ZZZZ
MKEWKLVALLAAGVVFAAEPALAQNLSPVQTMLQTIVTALTGPIGRLISIIALVVSGYMFFTGRMNWTLVLAVFIGVVLVFSAPAIIDGFATN